MGELDDLVKEFLIESYENLDQLDRDFVALENEPDGSGAREKLKSIFRTIHTIKGTCGCLGFGKLESVAHVAESLLSRLRDGELLMDKDITTGLLRSVDAIREILGFIETTAAEGDKEYTAVREALVALNARPSLGAEGAAPVTAPPMTPAPEAVAEPVAAAAPAVEAVVAAPAEEAQVEAEPAPAPAERRDVLPKDEAGVEHDRRAGDSVAGNAIRVDVGLLDKLMNLVGELVLARNQVLQYTAAQEDPALVRTAQRLNLITTELQEGVMKTRMQPIGNLWNKFPRVVRDVATACQKRVRIEMEGRETELDKTIIEAIKDPLTHVIRNSVDHGVESPEKRRALGKDEEGVLFMRAFHEGGQVNIEIKDDGKGIDPEVIKRKAVEKGLITPDQAARMGEREAINLIFAPGFSTAEKVTNVSGRGVGMDVVKTNIEKIGGTVDVQSKVGQGTVLRIKIPLTLAIIPALVVTSAGERFAIPQVSLLELVRLEEQQAERAIEMIHGAPVYRLRGQLLPLVYLGKELRTAPAGRRAAGAVNIVVLQADDRQFGLVVDEINDTEEIVVKPLGKQFKGLNVFAGATIMGDGRVALILDVMGLAQRASVLAGHKDRAAADVTTASKAEQQERQTLLLVKVAGHRRMAIPLSTVARLEEFAAGSIETSGDRDVVQYRGQIMPLVSLTDVLTGRRRRRGEGGPAAAGGGSDKLQAVVYTHGGRSYGLAVDRILDIVEEAVTVRHGRPERGVLGSAVIQEKVTELLDLEGVIRLFETEGDGPTRRGRRGEFDGTAAPLAA